MSFQICFLDQIHERDRITVSVANSEEEFNNTTVKELKRKLIPQDELENTILLYRYETLKRNRTLGSYGIKHQDLIITKRRGASYTVIFQLDSSDGHVSEVTHYFEDDDDEEEGKDISRTQSMENVTLMQQPDHK